MITAVRANIFSRIATTCETLKTVFRVPARRKSIEYDRFHLSVTAKFFRGGGGCRNREEFSTTFANGIIAKFAQSACGTSVVFRRRSPNEYGIAAGGQSSVTEFRLSFLGHRWTRRLSKRETFWFDSLTIWFAHNDLSRHCDPFAHNKRPPPSSSRYCCRHFFHHGTRRVNAGSSKILFKRVSVTIASRTIVVASLVRNAEIFATFYSVTVRSRYSMCCPPSTQQQRSTIVFQSLDLSRRPTIICVFAFTLIVRYGGARGKDYKCKYNGRKHPVSASTF